MGCPGQNPVEVEPRSDVEVVRLRPGMFIGNVRSGGLHALLFQLVESSLSAFSAGRGQSVRVALGRDNAVEVEDDAPPEWPDTGLEFAFTHWPGHYRPPGQRDSGAYLAANALSERLSVTARTDGSTYQHSFRRGETHAVVQMGGPPNACGLTVAFKPDPDIFGSHQFDAATIRDRLRELAFLHSGVRITFTDETVGTHDAFEYADGIREYVKFLNADRRPLHADAIVLRGEEQGVRYEVGLQWCDDEEGLWRSFANHYFTVQGGTHDAGLRNGVAAGLRDFMQTAVADAGRFEGEDLRVGLTAVVSVWLGEPMFMGATRSHLGNPEAETVVRDAVRRGVCDYFAANRNAAERVVKAVVAARDAREAARTERRKKTRGG